MESLFKFFVVIVVLFISIIGAAAVFGYSIANCGKVDDISETPCTPFLSNGKSNSHYRSMFYDCQRDCLGKKNIKLDVKTCNCSCE